MPSAVSPCEPCQRFSAASVWGPNTPSAETPMARCSASTPPPRAATERVARTPEARALPPRLSTGPEPMPSRERVWGPAMPSTVSPWLRW